MLETRTGTFFNEAEVKQLKDYYIVREKCYQLSIAVTLICAFFFGFSL